MSIVNEPNREPKPLPSEIGKPGRTIRPGRRWWQRWSVRLLLAFLVCIGALASYYAYRRHRAAEELREAVADLDRTDPGWRLRDIEAARAVVPENENSAVVVAEAFRWLPQGWPSNEFASRFSDLSPQEQLDAEDMACLRNELAETQIALGEARKLAIMPNGRHPITYQRNFISTLLPHAQNTRVVFTLSRFDVLLQTQDGDLKGALRSCRALLNAARSLGDEPLFITQLVRIAGVGMTCTSAERVLAQGEPDPDDLLELQKLLELEEKFPRLLVGTRGERAGMHELLDALECDDATLADAAEMPASGKDRPSGKDRLTGFVVRDYVRSQHATLLALQTEAVAISALPAHERAVPMNVWTANVLAERSDLVLLLVPKNAKMDSAAGRTDGQLRCLIAALAAERYRRQQGHWPDRLQQLVPEFLSSVPLDPKDGEPLRFHQRSDRVVVYSLWKTMNHGPGTEIYDPDEPSPPGVGIAVHLFDVKFRRQPPRPKPVIPDDDPQ